MVRRGVAVLAALAAAGGTPARAQTGLLVVAHGANAEWNARVRETVGQVRWPLGPVALAYLMGPEAAMAGWDSAVARLVRGGATSITVVPLLVSSHSGHYRQIEFYAGLRDSWDGIGSGHDHAANRPPPVPVRVTPALDGAPELGAALAVRWSALDPDDRHRPVVLVAHGPTDDAEAQRWLVNIRGTTDRALRAAGFTGELRVGLLRDDAPPAVRAAAVAQLRDTVSALVRAADDSVLVLPVLISSGTINKIKIPSDLADLPIRYVPTPLAPRAELARWIERSGASTLP